MKKATRLFAALIALSLTAATLSACSSDDDRDMRRTEQTSTWKNTNRDGMREQNRTYSRTSQK